jgi:hypothetical protein
MNINMPSKWRVTANVDKELLEKLEVWAASENRSTSSLVATILKEAIKSHEAGVYKHSSDFPTPASEGGNDQKN